MSLERQQLIQVRLVDIEGKPAANIAVELNAIQPTKGKGNPEDGVGFRALDPRPEAAPLPLVTDNEGLLTIPHIPPDHGVHLMANGNEHFAPQQISLNTGMSEERGEHDGTYRSLVKNMKAGEIATLPRAGPIL